MGKRKSSSKPMGPKKADPLPTAFTCLFCNHEKAVTVKLDKKAGVGNLDCRTCGQKFQCGINYLSAAVDVFGEWVDAAETVSKQDNVSHGYTGTGRTSASRLNRDIREGHYYEAEVDDRQYEGDDLAADEERA